MAASWVATLLIICSAFVVGCGTLPSDVTSPPPTTDTPDDSETICDDCGGTDAPRQPDPAPPTRWQAQPHVRVEPEQLMFYSDTSMERIFKEQHVTITNLTPGPIMVMRTYVADDPRQIRSSGDASHFSIPTLDTTPTLAHGDSLTVKVRFSGDPQQRTALLVVETTHPSYRSLVVQLQGKLFTGW